MHDDSMDDGLSDSELSQFEAEIEKDLSSTPESGTPNGANGHASDDAMDIDSDDDLRPSHAGKGRRRGSTKEYFDPDLYLLRRSVCHSFNHHRRSDGLIRFRVVQEQNPRDLSMYVSL
jgi:hypothetical protein